MTKGWNTADLQRLTSVYCRPVSGLYTRPSANNRKPETKYIPLAGTFLLAETEVNPSVLISSTVSIPSILSPTYFEIAKKPRATGASQI